MNEPVTDAALQRRTDQFLDRVRRTGQQSMAAIAEAVADSARRIGQRPTIRWRRWPMRCCRRYG